MNHFKLMKKVKDIEGDSIFELANVRALRKNASAENRIVALKADRDWLEDHIQMVCRLIDDLIDDLDVEQEASE